MKQNHKIILFTASVLLLSSCQKTKDVLGFNRVAPDEFSVVSNAPLSLPPEFEIRPPYKKLKINNQLQDSAKNILFPNGESKTVKTDIDEATQLFIAKADIASANSNIRETVNREYAELAIEKNEKGFSSYPLGFFKGESKDYQGDPLDANSAYEDVNHAKAQATSFDRQFKAGDVSHTHLEQQEQSTDDPEKKQGFLNRVFGF